MKYYLCILCLIRLSCPLMAQDSTAIRNTIKEITADSQIVWAALVYTDFFPEQTFYTHYRGMHHCKVYNKTDPRYIYNVYWNFTSVSFS